jgi:hypothetical protein
MVIPRTFGQILLWLQHVGAYVALSSGWGGLRMPRAHVALLVGELRHGRKWGGAVSTVDRLWGERIPSCTCNLAGPERNSLGVSVPPWNVFADD